MFWKPSKLPLVAPAKCFCPTPVKWSLGSLTLGYQHLCKESLGVQEPQPLCQESHLDLWQGWGTIVATRYVQFWSCYVQVSRYHHKTPNPETSKINLFGPASPQRQASTENAVLAFMGLPWFTRTRWTSLGVHWDGSMGPSEMSWCCHVVGCSNQKYLGCFDLHVSFCKFWH